MEDNQLADLEVLLGHSFRDKNLLLNALSHSSIKTDDRPSNERLEFLGDSVLGLVVSEVLYRRFPDEDEGVLTRIKSHAVSRASLQRIAAAMSLERFILVGKGVWKREIPASLLGNLFEAIVGAMYLDTGLAAARKFILRHLDIVIDEIVDDRAERNYKSLLQHYCQREHGAVPVYRVLREAGPAHNRQFDVFVVLHGREIGRARAVSKKEAEQGAARAALIHYREIDENPRQPVRGAGVILSVGPSGGGRRGPSREEESDLAWRESAAPGGDAREAVAPAGPPQGEGGGRRRRRRRRGGGGGGPPHPAPAMQGGGSPHPSQIPDQEPASADAGPSPQGPGNGAPPPGGAPHRRRRRRGGRGRGRRGPPPPGAGAPAESAPPPADPPPSP